MIGGLTRDTVPIPLYLRSGDIIVMTGPCRKAFHGKETCQPPQFIPSLKSFLFIGVPLIIEDTLPDYLSNNNTYQDALDWELYGDFMSTARINLNIRQVYPKDTKEQDKL